MKTKPKYKKTDYVEFKYTTLDDVARKTRSIKRGFIRSISLIDTINNSEGKLSTICAYFILTRKGNSFAVLEEDIIRKLPINRDKNGRFTNMSSLDNEIDLSYHSGLIEHKKVLKRADEIEKQAIKWHEKDCTCYNCPKCEAEMREYYKKTGELKRGIGYMPKALNKAKALIDENFKLTEDAAKPYDEFGSRPKVEEKKPSDRIVELYIKDKSEYDNKQSKWINNIMKYLDEQFEKGK